MTQILLLGRKMFGGAVELREALLVPGLQTASGTCPGIAQRLHPVGGPVGCRTIRFRDLEGGAQNASALKLKRQENT